MSGLHQRRSGRRPWWRLALGGLVVAMVLLAALPPASADQAPSVSGSVWAFEKASTDRLWAVSKGGGITVAVVDSGVDSRHPDLRGQVVGGGDFGDGSTANGTQDVGGQQGHGTEMASLIVGSGMNYKRHGLRGLAPNAKVLSFGAYVDGRPSAAAVAKAVRASVRKGAQILLIPALGSNDPDVASALRYARAHNVVVFSGTTTGSAATGDTSRTRPANAAAFDGVVNVAAVDEHGEVWPTGGGGRHVVVAAPGVGILGAAPNDTYWIGNDSSIAAAWAAGVAALIRSRHTDWTAAQTIQKIIDTAQGKGSGCQEGCGYGVVDPVRAVTDMSTPTARTNPLLSQPAPRRSPAESPIAGVPPERLLLFLVSGLAALTLYVAVTVVFIWRQRGQGGRYDGMT